MYGQNTSLNDIDESQRLFELRRLPLSLNSGFSNRTVVATVFVQQHAHSIKLEGRTFRTAAFYNEQVSRNWYTGAVDYATSTVSLSDKIALGRYLSAQLREEVNHGNMTGQGSIGSVALDWLPNGVSTLELLASKGVGQPAPPALRNLGDPSTALYNCGNGTVLVSGPSDPLSTQRQSSVSLAYKRRTGENRQVQVLAGQQETIGLQRDLLMPLSGIVGTVPGGLPGYVQAIGSYWEQNTVCGTAPFDPSRVYVQQYVGGLDQVSRFLNLSARFSLGRRVLAIPALTYNALSFRGLGPRFTSPESLYADGRQLPLVSRVNAGLTLDYIDVGRHEWLLNAQYTGAGNRNNLPPYVVVNTGITTPVQHGRLSLVVANAFNASSRRFTESLGFNPIPLPNGSRVSFPSTPLAPLQWSLTFEPRFPGALM